jgi:hypothetical protein
MGYRPATEDDIEYLPIPGDAPYDQTLGSWLADQFAALREPLTNFFETTFGPEE